MVDKPPSTGLAVPEAILTTGVTVKNTFLLALPSETNNFAAVGTVRVLPETGIESVMLVCP